MLGRLPKLLLAAASLLVLVWLVRREARGFLPGEGRTTITQGAIIQRLQSVAKLVTTEAAVRDVVSYQNTRLGSTKRALVIVTGKAMVGIDLTDHPRVTIDAETKQIRVALPHARLLGVDVEDLKTYDEARGLWNPFHPADRDTIFLLARAQLMHAARDLSVLEHAETSARQLVTALLGQEGYSVTVEFEPFLQPARD